MASCVIVRAQIPIHLFLPEEVVLGVFVCRPYVGSTAKSTASSSEAAVPPEPTTNGGLHCKSTVTTRDTLKNAPKILNMWPSGLARL